MDVPDEVITWMDNAPGDRHVLAAAVASDAQLVVTANVSDFKSPRFVSSGRITIEPPSVFLTTVLDDYPDTMGAVLWHLAGSRRGVQTIGDVLDEFDRNAALRVFVGQACRRLV